MRRMPTAAKSRARKPPATLSPEARQYADEGYVNLRGAFPNVDDFNRVIGGIVRDNASKPVFMRYEKFFSLDDIGFSCEKFASTSYMLRLPEIHTLSKELLDLVNACGFEGQLRAVLSGRSAGG